MNFQRVLAISLLVLLSDSSSGQVHKYIPFPDTSAIWVRVNLNEFGQETGGFQYYLKGDTILNGHTYQNVFECGDSSLKKEKSIWFGGLRNDTLTKRVHFWSPSSQIDHILYDFSLLEGDTVPQDYISRYKGSVVINVDTILIESNEHLVFYYSNGLIPCIEGIGSMAGLFERAYFFEGGTEFVCLMLGKNKEPYYTLPPHQCALYHYTSVTDIQISQLIVRVNPNPIVTSSVIELTGFGDSIEQMIVYESTGRIAFIHSKPESNVIQIGNRINMEGLYVYQILTKSGRIFTGRMIK